MVIDSSGAVSAAGSLTGATVTSTGAINVNAINTAIANNPFANRIICMAVTSKDQNDFGKLEKSFLYSGSKSLKTLQDTSVFPDT